MIDCLVIGGGVIGLLTARSLHLAGMKVLLIERGPLGGESSWAGGGIISPLYPWAYPDSVNILAERSKQLYPELVSQLHEESGVDCELINSGLLFVDKNDAQQVNDWAKHWTVDVQTILDPHQIHAIEPALHPDIERALWMPEINQIRNPKLVQALRGSFDQLDIQYLQNTPVDELLISKGRAQGVRCAEKSYYADKIVVASGAWTANLLSGVSTVKVEPVKGQMIMLHGEPGVVERMVLSHGHYIIPRKDGRVLAGSTLERTGFDKTVSETALQSLLADAEAIVPALSELTLERQWAGLRPGTQNGIPYICEHDEVDGLYIHAGHYRNGIVLGPASVQLMTEIILGQTTFCDASTYTLTASH